LKKVYIYGRGEIATRLIEKINQRERFMKIVNDINESDMILLTNDENKNEIFLKENEREINEKIIFDFSSYFKKRGEGEYILEQFLNESSNNIIDKKRITLPACYASSVIIPIKFLEKNFNIKGSEISAVSIGGKSTLGKNKNIGLGNLRVASFKNENYHLNEIKNHLYKFDNMFFKLLVGDLREGILTIINLKVSETKLKNDLEVIFDLEEEFVSKNSQIDSIADISNNHDDISRFWIKYNEENRSYDIYSYVNNLNLPVELALKSIESV